MAEAFSQESTTKTARIGKRHDVLSSSSTAEASISKRGRAAKESLNKLPSLPSETGTVFVFGNGDTGQLGLGEDMLDRKKPFPIRDLDDEEIVDVVAGGLHTVAITKEGKVLLLLSCQTGIEAEGTSNG